MLHTRIFDYKGYCQNIVIRCKSKGRSDEAIFLDKWICKEVIFQVKYKANDAQAGITVKRYSMPGRILYVADWEFPLNQW